VCVWRGGRSGDRKREAKKSREIRYFQDLKNKLMESGDYKLPS
jgi:hypothetical protein